MALNLELDWAALQGLKTYDLGRPLEAGTPVGPMHPRFMMALLRRHGDYVRGDGGSGSNELLSLGGHTGTHIDALCHISQDGQLHGGVDAREAVEGGRYRTHGAETLPPIICRGVLIDAAGARGVASLAAAERLDASALQEICAAQGIEVRAGDAVLVHTGWPVGRYDDAAAYNGAETGVPGPDVSAARWLAERGIRVTGADTVGYEWLPPHQSGLLLPVHRTLLQEAGIPIIEVLDLAALARDKVYEFLFVAIPLRIVGGTASPIRPLALIPG